MAGDCNDDGVVESGDGGAMDVSRSTVYVGRGRSVVAIDAGEPAAPALRETVPVGSRVEALRSHGGRVYVNGWRDERIVIEATADPPAVVGTHDVGDWVAGAQFGMGVACRLTRSDLEVAVTGDAP